MYRNMVYYQLDKQTLANSSAFLLREFAEVSPNEFYPCLPLVQTKSVNKCMLEFLDLHRDLVRAIPVIEMRSSQLGSLPQNSTGSLGILETIYGWVKDGLMDLAELLQGLANFVSEWGMRWLGALSESYGAVREATQKVVDAVNAILDWIIAKVGEFLNELFTPLKNALESAAGELYDILECAYQNYLVSGTFGLENEEHLANWIVEKIILPAIVVSVAITVISYLFAPYATLGAVIALGITAVLIALWAQDKQIEPRQIDISMLSPTKTIQQNFIDFYNSLVPSFGNSRGGRQQQPAWLFLILTGFTMGGLLTSAISAYLVSSYSTVGLAAMCAVMVALFGFFTYLVPADNPVAEGFNHVIAYTNIFVFILCMLDLFNIITLGPDDCAFKNKASATIFALIGCEISLFSLYISGDIIGWW